MLKYTMKNYGDIKPLSFSQLNGISQNTIENHYSKLYQGYVKKWQEIQERLKNVDKSTANATFSDFRELKLEESFAGNAIILHEAYFDVLGGDGQINGDIIKAIEAEFGSFENWLTDFKALGLCSRGWVVLAYDYNDGSLRNYLLDVHNLHGVWGAAPVLVLDMYEHAYFIDFGTDKKSYIDTFFQNINWSAVDKKYQKITK